MDHGIELVQRRPTSARPQPDRPEPLPSTALAPETNRTATSRGLGHDCLVQADALELHFRRAKFWPALSQLLPISSDPTDTSVDAAVTPFTGP